MAGIGQEWLGGVRQDKGSFNIGHHRSYKSGQERYGWDW